jgi:dihydrofolate reductase
MKKILYLAQTVNGYIARENNSTPWSKEEFTTYYSTVKKTKNLILGRRTYQIMKKYGELAKCGKPFTVIVTKSRKLKPGSRVAIANSPSAAVKILKSKGFNEAIIGGGSRLATSFFKKGLIDEIYLDVEPMVFGKGIPLFQKSGMEAKLRLIKTAKLSRNTIRLQYRVLK